MSQIIGSIITDCYDDDARSRQELRFTSLFGTKPTLVGVQGEVPDLEAAGLLQDQLDILDRTPGVDQAVILINVSPRGETKKKWDNGTPFCYFRIGKTLVVSSFAGSCLSLVRKSGLVRAVNVLDIPTVTQAAVEWGELTPEQADSINHTQFRSLEFLPLVAYWLQQGRVVPSQEQSLDELPEVSNRVWFVDNFGNAKTTLLPADIAFEEGQIVTLTDGQTAVCYRRLTDVPPSQTAITIGSSGYKDQRFLEVAVQWKEGKFNGSSKASDRHNLRVGSSVLSAES